MIARRKQFARSSTLALAAALPVLGLAAAADAGPVRVWSADDGGNGHSYELILDNTSKFEDAAGDAGAAGGHLVTITSAAEQSFVEGLLADFGAATGGYWIGLAKTADENVNVWINGESFSFENYADGQPDNFTGVESKFQVLWTAEADGPQAARRGQWNDVPSEGYPSAVLNPPVDQPDIRRAGYIIERTPTATAIPLPAAMYAFPAAALVAGIAARRMKRR